MASGFEGEGNSRYHLLRDRDRLDGAHETGMFAMAEQG
ncbi:putative ATP-dependent serine protease [Sphingobium jiangsuense]|uniref:Putative ATP-dependent serine protease n=2 Tax=Sphingobium jiangsuense TaxID=870476 RepID=A0A7W6BPP6_9SPHN|nr:putative ATP-dependent serine protease [Sphingobium jiangsuense]